MPMTLEGGCRCGAVAFRLQSHTPQPYQRCYCSICRKTAGGGGYAINIMGAADTLEIEGKDAIGLYRAEIERDGVCETSTGERRFCTRCGSALWTSDPAWAQWVYPFASIIDTALPVPPQSRHGMLRFKAPWVVPQIAPGDECFEEFPEESIEDWHRARDLWID